jgi:hypothetical protein
MSDVIVNEFIGILGDETGNEAFASKRRSLFRLL